MPPPSHCARQTRNYDRDRYLCVQFAPADRREALYALYAFNQETAAIREKVSEPLLGHMRLAWWREALDAVFAGTPADHPVVRALAAAVGAHGLPRAPFDRILEGRALDLEPEPPADMAALVAYAEVTAGTLTALVLEVLGLSETGGEAGRAAHDAGRHVGIAWALTGLIRAEPYHAAAGRGYLPTDVARPAVAAVAREHLDEARRLRGRVPKAALAALLPAVLADVYLKRLSRDGYDSGPVQPRGGASGRLLRLLFNGLRGRF